MSCGAEKTGRGRAERIPEKDKAKEKTPAGGRKRDSKSGENQRWTQKKSDK